MAGPGAERGSEAAVFAAVNMGWKPVTALDSEADMSEVGTDQFADFTILANMTLGGRS